MSHSALMLIANYGREPPLMELDIVRKPNR